MNEIFFTADTHWSHLSILKHCQRNFKTIEEHDETLIANWNSTVGKRDLVYHLGDFAMIPKQDDGTLRMKLYRRLRMRLNSKIALLVGNHDQMSRDVYDLFTDVGDIMEPKVDGHKLFLCHYPMRSYNGSFHPNRWNFHGHNHNRLPELPYLRSKDVGVDGWNYKPIPWEVLKKEMERKELIWSEYYKRSKVD